MRPDSGLLSHPDGRLSSGLDRGVPGTLEPERPVRFGPWRNPCACLLAIAVALAVAAALASAAAADTASKYRSAVNQILAQPYQPRLRPAGIRHGVRRRERPQHRAGAGLHERLDPGQPRRAGVARVVPPGAVHVRRRRAAARRARAAQRRRARRRRRARLQHARLRVGDPLGRDALRERLRRPRGRSARLQLRARRRPRLSGVAADVRLEGVRGRPRRRPLPRRAARHEGHRRSSASARAARTRCSRSRSTAARSSRRASSSAALPTRTRRSTRPPCRSAARRRSARIPRPTRSCSSSCRRTTTPTSASR